MATNIRVEQGVATHEQISLGSHTLVCQIKPASPRFLVLGEEDGMTVVFWAGPSREQAEHLAASFTTELAIMEAEVEARGATRQ